MENTKLNDINATRDDSDGVNTATNDVNAEAADTANGDSVPAKLEEAFINYLRYERNMSPETIRAYEKDLYQFLRFFQLGWDASLMSTRSSSRKSPNTAPTTHRESLSSHSST